MKISRIFLPQVTIFKNRSPDKQNCSYGAWGHLPIGLSYTPVFNLCSARVSFKLWSQSLSALNWLRAGLDGSFGLFLSKYKPVIPFASGEEARKMLVSVPFSGDIKNGLPKREKAPSKPPPKLVATTPGCRQLAEMPSGLTVEAS